MTWTTENSWPSQDSNSDPSIVQPVASHYTDHVIPALFKELINSVWKKDKLPDQWKESIIVPVHKKGSKTDCSNFHGISLLSTSYEILYSILLSRLSPYIDEIIGHHQCGFQCSGSTTNRIFCVRQILEKKWEYSVTVHQLFVDFKKAYDSVRREVLYSILIQFGVPMKLVRLIKCV
jgi:hypothetical protein